MFLKNEDAPLLWGWGGDLGLPESLGAMEHLSELYIVRCPWDPHVLICVIRRPIKQRQDTGSANRIPYAALLSEYFWVIG